MPPLGLVTHEREGAAVRLGGLKVSMSCANPTAFSLTTTMAIKTSLPNDHPSCPGAGKVQG